MKKFEMAEMEIEKFEVVDVITSSDCALHCPSDDSCGNATDWG